MPPPKKSNNGMYIALALLFLGGTVAALLFLGEGDKPAETTAPVATQVPARSTALDNGDLDLNAEPPPAPVEAAPVAQQQPEKRAARPADDWDGCDGEVDRAGAAQAFGDYNTNIRACYERELKANPNLQGMMSLTVKIGADGHVVGVKTGGSLRDRDVFACVRGYAERMRFPRISNGKACAVIAQNFNFTPASGH